MTPVPPPDGSAIRGIVIALVWSLLAWAALAGLAALGWWAWP